MSKNLPKQITLSIIISLCAGLIHPILSPVAAQINTQKLEKEDYAEGEVIVKYREDKLNIDSRSLVNQFKLNSIETELEKKNQFPDINTAVYKSNTKSTQQLIKEFSANPNIEYVEPNYIVRIFADLDSGEPADPNDLYFDNLWGFDNDAQSGGTTGADIQIKSAWELIDATGSGTEIQVGIIDTGIDYTHPDLRENIWFNPDELVTADDNLDGGITYSEVINNLTDCTGTEGINLKDLFCSSLEDGIDNDGNGYIDDFIGWDTYNGDNDPYDDHTTTHGTHVAGILGASKNNSIGVAGINDEIKLVAIKAFNSAGSGNFGTITSGVQYSDSLGIKITNNSFGTTSSANLREDQDNPAFGFKTLRDAMKNSGINNDTLFVVAAGNGRYISDGHPDNTSAGYDIDTHPDWTSYPAAYDLDNIITIASTDRTDTISAFSNYGQTSVDIGAPGSEIYSSLGNSTYGYKSGTSMATPMVAGALSLLSKYLEYINGTVPNYSELKAQLLDHSEYVTGLDNYLSADTDGVHGKRLNVFDSLPPEVEYTLTPLQSAGDIPDGGSLALDLTATKSGTFNLAASPDTYSKTHSISITRNGLYEMEFEDQGRNSFQEDLYVGWILNTSIDNRHPVAVHNGNETAFTISGGCYGNNNDVTLTVDDEVNDPVTASVVYTPIQCNNGYWSIDADLSSLNNGNLTFSPTQPSIQSYSKTIVKTEYLPADPNITSPSDNYTTTSTKVTLSGTGEPLATISITGGSAPATTIVSAGGIFTTEVSLNSSQTNTLVASSIDQYNVPSANTDSINVIQRRRSSSGGGGSSTTTPEEDLEVTPVILSDISGTTFETYINNLVGAGVINGFSDGTYRPDENVTREQMAKFIVTAFNFKLSGSYSDNFPDISSDSKFFEYIQILKQLQIVGGYSDGTYRPTNYVTRGEVTKFIALAFYRKDIDISGELKNIFPDLPNDNPFAYYINYLAQNEVNNETLISGYSDGTYKADDPLTRGQMAKIIWNSIQFVESKT